MIEPEPLIGAHVAGWSAFAIDAVLHKHLDPYLRAMSPAQRRQVERTHEAIHRAALYWKAQAISDDGNAEAGAAEIRSSSAGELSTVDVARILGVSERRVCQLAVEWMAEGLARKVGRSWLIDAAAVELHHETMRRSA